MGLLDMLGSLISGKPSTPTDPNAPAAPGLLGQTPDQASQFEALQHQAAMRAIVPSLISAGVGYLAHPKYWGRGGAILAGLRDGADTYSSESADTVNQGLAFAKDAAQNRRNDILDQATISNANAATSNANSNAVKAKADVDAKAPVGYDWTASLRGKDPRIDALLPTADVASTFNKESVQKWLGSNVPAAMHNLVMEDQGAQNVKLHGQTVGIEAGHLANDNQRTALTMDEAKPIGYDAFAGIRKSYPQLAATLPDAAHTAQMSKKEVGNTMRTMTASANANTAMGKTVGVGYDPFAELRTAHPEMASVIPGPEEGANMTRQQVYAYKKLLSGENLRSILNPGVKATTETKVMPDGTSTKFNVRRGKDGNIIDATPIAAISGGAAPGSKKSASPLDNRGKLSAQFLREHPMDAFSDDMPAKFEAFANSMGYDNKGNALPGAVPAPIDTTSPPAPTSTAEALAPPVPTATAPPVAPIAPTASAVPPPIDIPGVGTAKFGRIAPDGRRVYVFPDGSEHYLKK